MPAEDIERAEADGTLGLLAIDQMILADQAPEVHARAEVEALHRSGRGCGAVLAGARLDRSAARRARLQRPSTSRCCSSSTSCFALGLIEKDVALQMARVIGSSISRIASAQIDAIETRIDEPVLEDGTEPAVLRARFLLAVDAAHPRIRVAASHAGRGRDAGWCERRDRRARRR